MNEQMLFKIRSQCGIILKEMQNYPKQWFTVGHFCGKPEHCFVGYKASARLCELQKAGVLTSRWSEKKTVLGGKVKEYHLAKNHYVEFQNEKLQVLEDPGMGLKQPNLFL